MLYPRTPPTQGNAQSDLSWWRIMGNVFSLAYSGGFVCFSLSPFLLLARTHAITSVTHAAYGKRATNTKCNNKSNSQRHRLRNHSLTAYRSKVTGQCFYNEGCSATKVAQRLMVARQPKVLCASKVLCQPWGMCHHSQGLSRFLWGSCHWQG